MLWKCELPSLKGPNSKDTKTKAEKVVTLKTRTFNNLKFQILC
jgi:hypothetical protein